jgi:hypothetical protein
MRGKPSGKSELILRFSYVIKWDFARIDAGHDEQTADAVGITREMAPKIEFTIGDVPTVTASIRLFFFSSKIKILPDMQKFLGRNWGA